MERAVYIILVLVLAANTSCKKEPVSNSMYTNADIVFSKFKYQIRSAGGDDTIKYGVDGSASLTLWEEKANVFINEEKFEGPESTPSGFLYIFGSYNVTEAYTHRFDQVNLKIKSQNGATDLDFSTSSIPFYAGVVPYLITCSNGLTLQINGVTVQGADSIRINISGFYHEVDTVVGSSTHTITFSPSVLSSIAPMSGSYETTMLIDARTHASIAINNKTFKITNAAVVQYDISLKP